MGWNGDNGEIISKAPTRQYREGFDAINWSKPPAIVVDDEVADVSPAMWDAIEKTILDDAQPKAGTWWCVVHEKPVIGFSEIAIDSPNGRCCSHGNFSKCQAKFYRHGKSDKITIT